MSNQKLVIAAVLCGVVGLGIGVLIGYFSRNPNSPNTPDPVPIQSMNIAERLMNEVNATILENNLRFLTQRPHMAGGEVDEELFKQFFADKWEEFGLDVEIHPYEVLLSYPNKTDPNYVAILSEEGNEVFKSQTTEKVLEESENDTDVTGPFNAYSPAGDAEGELVYVNYGDVEDFQYLERNLSINFRGKICIARYGKIYRGDKAVQAEKYGCTGLILYTDPKEYTVTGTGVFPESWYLPGSGVHRGKVALGQGDPETVGYPSIGNAWRASEEQLPLPNIPITPIGYDDAEELLVKMRGPEVPSSWIGGLNITYRVGPGFIEEHVNSTVKIHVNMRKERKVIHNVIGYIRGEIEPDRYVIYGVHRDAWVFGGMDPSSGGAIVLELARIFGKAVEDGWKPRRSIVFCSWGAEEFGLIGSTEWVEEFQKNLAARSVVYINTDTAVLGTYTLYASAVPSLKNLIYDVTKSIPNPDASEVEAGRPYLYDSWKRRWPEDPTAEEWKPVVRSVGSGSDYTMFFHLPGVSIIDLAYAYDLTTGIDFYPVYHSVHDTFFCMKSFVDPEFKSHVTLTRVMAEVGRRLVDSEILPFDPTEYALKLIEHKEQLLGEFGSKMTANGIDTGLLDTAMNDFKTAAEEFQIRIESVNNTDDKKELTLRGINDQLMQLERAFIDQNGITSERSVFKHVIYAPSQHNKYASSAFPGLIDSMFDVDVDPDQEERWDEVRRQYSVLLYHMSSAASTLKDFTPMKGFSNIQGTL